MEKIGVIGGSGLYELDGLAIKEEREVSTPFGTPSSPLTIAELGGKEVVFLARHGRGHGIQPSDIPFRANIYALKEAGVTQVISVSAVGSMKEEIVPGHLVFPDQFIDRTVGRERTFFSDGIVGHVTFADPICKFLQAKIVKAAEATGVTHHVDGTYICIEGPQFSTRAESLLFRSWGVSVIGMTNMPEARLAREAEMSYATIALATDYDCWHEGHEDVSVEAVLATIKSNVINAKKVIRQLVLDHDAEAARPEGVSAALKFAVMTSPEIFPAEARARIELLIGKYFPA